MLDINILKKSWYFKEVHLEKWEVLFDEWEINNNIYIILSWELVVHKYMNKSKNKSKVLAYLWKNDIFWEASLNNNLPKKSWIKANYKSILLTIPAKKLTGAFLIKYKNEWLNLMKYIIYLANKRLSDANLLITANYNITQEIKNLDSISFESIFKIIEKLKNSINITDIIYYEINPVMKNYLTLKYDTRIPWKMQSKIIEITNNKLYLLDLRIDDYYNFTQKLSIWSNELGYFIFLKKWSNFNESDKKVLASTSSVIAWLIKQKQLMDEERDKEFMEY